jgi:class 3 adenylate cyclase/tetratricopeptide (TPR) repeat protein
MSQKDASDPRADASASLPDWLNPEQLRRYLPGALADELIDELTRPAAAHSRLVEAFVHLAAARYSITTYLPCLVVHQLLEERLESPWLRWVEGSLLFADLSGSTALAERLSALGREGTELVTDFLNHIFAVMIEVVQDYGGDLVSFGGDALLVFFSDRRHPRAAARAALALQDALHGYVRTVAEIGSFPMHLHIGIESGPVAFASAGCASGRHLVVLGSAVNRVATAEGLAGPGEVVAGPGAWATLCEFATDAQEVAAGFFRIRQMRPAAQPHEPLPEEQLAAAPPEEAIPQILADLDRIGPYMPPVLLGRILADPQRPQIEAELRPVTVLFAQTTGLETLAETLSPERSAYAIQAYIESMQTAIENFGGVVNKLDIAAEGVKLVAIFGAPTAYEDHAERAVRAGLEMQARIAQVIAIIEQQVLQSSTPNTQRTIHQRIGLNLGTVFAGNVGSAIRKEYTVMGDAVNVAARVMSTTAWGEVWCSAPIASAVAGRIACEPRGTVTLKGKTAPLSLLRVTGVRDQTAALLTVDEGPLVGRERELRWLYEQLDSAFSGAGRAVRISGDAGVGKSRLVAEVVRAALGRGGRVVPAACFSYTAGIPYAAWSEWLKALCEIVSGDDDAQRMAKLAARLADLGAGMEEWLPLLGDLVRLDVPDNRLTRGLDPKLRQERRFELLQGLLLRAAAHAPLVVLFEDLHWADPISIDLWQRIVRVLDRHPVLLLGLHRPAAAFAEADGALVLELRELSDDESSRMVAALAGDGLPEAALRQIIDRAAGNPLFLAELLRALLEPVASDRRRTTGNASERPQTQVPIAASLDELPDSLNGLLLSRIDRLDETSRGVLRVASVIGQRIPFGVLQSIQATDQQQLLLQLTRLDEAEMTVLERAVPERVHTFRHALIQEVAYQSMLYARRRELHGRIGAYLERRYADDLDDYIGLLAHHYRLSDRRDKAVVHLLRAGRAASEVYANDEAEQYYRWALEALDGDDNDPHAWDVRDELSAVLATVGRYDEALEQLAAVLAAPGVSANAACRAHHKRGSVFEKLGQYTAALDELDRAMVIARTGAEVSRLAIPMINADVGLVYQRRGDYDLAIGACEEGLRHLWHDTRTRDDEQIEARLHSTLGGIYGMRGDYQRALHHFERSLEAREAIDDLAGMAISHNNLGYLWQLQSEYERAINHYQVAEELAKKINLRYMVVFAALNMAWSLISLGSYTPAEERARESLGLSTEMNDRRNIAQSYDILGLVAYHRGDYLAALDFYAQELQLHRELGSAPQEGTVLANRALVLNALDRFDEAAAQAGEALTRAEVLGAQRLKAEALNALAEAAIGRGDTEQATACGREAASISRSIGSKYDAGIAHRLIGRAVAASGGPFAFDFGESIGLFEAIKDRFELARTHAAYGAALIDSGDQIEGRAYLKQAQATFMAIGANGELQRLE